MTTLEGSDIMVALLRDNPLLLLFLVAAIGYPLGRIKIRGSSLGVAAVLFVGLAFGAISPDLRVPEVVQSLGLVLFVYTIGLASGPGFFASLRGRGLRDNLFALVMIGVAGAMAVGFHFVIDLRPEQTAGLFTGSLTSTPALAGVVEYLKHSGATGLALTDPVVGYSLAYPASVLGMMLMITLATRFWRVDYQAEASRFHETTATGEHLESRSIRITRPAAGETTVRDLVRRRGWNVLFGRIQHGGKVGLVREHTRFAPGDLVSAVGPVAELEKVAAYLGELGDDDISMDRRQWDYRRIFVSNPQVVGLRLRDLSLPRQQDAIITRVRRGDVEWLPHGDTVLELGDRVRVLTRRDNLDAVSHYFGDSYKALSEIDILSFSLGLALGMLLGLVPFPLPGGITLRLGMAGGPLIVALLLGAVERTGTVVWSPPYSANLILRQVGMVLFLAGVGTRSGYDFYRTLSGGQGLAMLGAGAVITCTVGLLALWVGYRLLKIPMGLLLGLVAGLQTQAATLGFALEQSHDELPNLGYATVYPFAMISKIVIAQLMVALLR
ncbi:MAG TPA: aspartate:alanine exchanger family transporter [Symbiobacteriaceae bacterium]|jgi:putative transport protein